MQNKVALITGASGFLGTYLVQSFQAKGYSTHTIGRSANNTIQVDISTSIPNINEVDVVIHAAGKAHVVPKNTSEAQEFWDVNVTGTSNLLAGLDKSFVKPSQFIFISSVSVYGLGSGENIPESSPLNAVDPYGKSKIEAEKLVRAWGEQNNVPVLIIRLPLVAGIHPPGNLGAMINGLKKGYYFRVLGGKARKSVVWAGDVADWLVSVPKASGTYHITDGLHPSFEELDSVFSSIYSLPKAKNMPYWMIKILSLVGDVATSLKLPFPLNSNKLTKIIQPLTFNDQKARVDLGWKPTSVIQHYHNSKF